MKLQHSLHEFMPYGAPDLLRSGRAHLSRALVVSSSGAALAFAAVLLLIPLIPRTPITIVPPDVFIPHDVMPDVNGPVHRTQPARVRPASTYSRGARVQPVKEKAKETPIVVDGGAKSGPVVDERTKGESRGGETGPPPIEPIVDDTPVSVFDTPPTAMTKITPEYPDFARQAMVEGRVVVLILIGRDGRVREAKVDERNHVLLLDAAAIEAARQWVFSPAQVNGHPVSVWSAIPFNFRLQ